MEHLNEAQKIVLDKQSETMLPILKNMVKKGLLNFGINVYPMTEKEFGVDLTIKFKDDILHCDHKQFVVNNSSKNLNYLRCEIDAKLKLLDETFKRELNDMYSLLRSRLF